MIIPYQSSKVKLCIHASMPWPWLPALGCCMPWPWLLHALALATFP